MDEKCCATKCSMSASLGLLVLRVVAGGFLVTHGWAKFHDPAMKSQFFDMVSSFGLPAPHAMAWAAIVAELAGGALLAVGFLTRLWAFMILCTMGVAIAKVHLHQDYHAIEPAALYGAIAVAFLLGGPGRISVDGMLFGKGKKEETPPDESVEKF